VIRISYKPASFFPVAVAEEEKEELSDVPLTLANWNVGEVELLDNTGICVNPYIFRAKHTLE